MFSEEDVFQTTLTSKGQIVIGSSLRKKLGLKPGHRLRESIVNGKIVLEPLKTPSELGGCLREMAQGRKTDEIISEIKEGWR